jgi:hypothetical protein
METDEQPKLDNGAGGSRATKTGKPERVGESGDEPINLILGEIQVLLAEKRTALSSLRTGIAGCQPLNPTPALLCIISGL